MGARASTSYRIDSISTVVAAVALAASAGEKRGHAMASRDSELTIVISQRRTHIIGKFDDAARQSVATKAGSASLDTNTVFRYVESDSRGQFEIDVQEGEVHF